MLLLLEPEAAARGAARAMACWYASVAPALFPFLALMPLLTCKEAARAYERLLGRLIRRLFHLPGAAAPGMVVAMTAGAPAGALAFRSIAVRGDMNRGQLARAAIAFSGFSPAFLIGGIGAGLLGSAAQGWRLLGAQMLTQMTLALVFRRAWEDRTRPVPGGQDGGDDQSIRGAVLKILGVCGYMALFGALAEVVGALVGRGPANVLLCLLDVPSGAAYIAGLPRGEGLRLLLLTAMCSFGGLCVAAQNLGALRGCGIGVGEYIGMRALAGLLAAGYMALLIRLPATNAAGLVRSIQGNPYATAGLVASLLAMPVLARIKKSVF